MTEPVSPAPQQRLIAAVEAIQAAYTSRDTFPQIITFANGRVVGMKGPGYLFVAPGK